METRPHGKYRAWLETKVQAFVKNWKRRNVPTALVLYLAGMAVILLTTLTSMCVDIYHHSDGYRKAIVASLVGKRLVSIEARQYDEETGKWDAKWYSYDVISKDSMSDNYLVSFACGYGDGYKTLPFSSGHKTGESFTMLAVKVRLGYKVLEVPNK